MAGKNKSSTKELAEKIEANIKNGNYPATIEGALKFLKDMMEMLGERDVKKTPPESEESTFSEVLNIMAEVVDEWSLNHSSNTSGHIVK